MQAMEAACPPRGGEHEDLRAVEYPEHDADDTDDHQRDRQDLRSSVCPSSICTRPRRRRMPRRRVTRDPQESHRHHSLWPRHRSATLLCGNGCGHEGNLLGRGRARWWRAPPDSDPAPGHGTASPWPTIVGEGHGRPDGFGVLRAVLATTRRPPRDSRCLHKERKPRLCKASGSRGAEIRTRDL
jgi:hypothetical protein